MPSSALTSRRLAAQRGVSFVEVLIVTAIIGIIVGITVPNFKRLKAKYETTTQLQVVLGLNDEARHEALKQRSDVVVEFTTTGVRTFVDDNSDGDLDGGEELLSERLYGGYLQHDPATDRNIKSDGVNFVVRFRSDGSVRDVDDISGGDPAVYYTDPNNNEFRLFVNSMSGAARLQKLEGSVWIADRDKWLWEY